MAYKEKNLIPPSSEIGYVVRTSFVSEAGVSSLCLHCKETTRHWEVWFTMALISYSLSKHTKTVRLSLYHIMVGFQCMDCRGRQSITYIIPQVTHIDGIRVSWFYVLLFWIIKSWAHLSIPMISGSIGSTNQGFLMEWPAGTGTLLQSCGGVPITASITGKGSS